MEACRKQQTEDAVTFPRASRRLTIILHVWPIIRVLTCTGGGRLLL